MSNAASRWSDFIPMLTWVWKYGGIGISVSSGTEVLIVQPPLLIGPAEEAGGGVPHRGGEDEDRRRETESPVREAAAGDQAETSH